MHFDLRPGCSQFPNMVAGDYFGWPAPPNPLEVGPTQRAEAP